MQCQRCSKKKATVFYRESVNGRVKTLRLCGECAEVLEQAGDIILLAGKGHETYQLIGTRRVPFSEREILLEALREKALAGIV